MPRPGELNTSYPDLLLVENKIELLEPFKGAKQHHKMKCLVCNHEWTATPISKRQTYKKYGVGGCPKCSKQRKDIKYSEHRQSNLSRINEKFIILTEGYDGRRHLTDYTTYEKIKVRNKECGHEFDCSPSNLLTQHVECAVCGPIKRVEPLTKWSKENSRKWRETASEWKIYKSKVTSLTAQTYHKHKKEINPQNLKRGKAGIEGAHHLDHIVPIRYCFDNNIPAEVCSDKSNLQMIGWKSNIGSRNHLKGAIPPLFLKYIQTNNKQQTFADVITANVPNGKQFVRVGESIATVYDEQHNYAYFIIPLDESQANLKTAINIQKNMIEHGVKYIILFEDEFVNPQLILSKLSHYSNTNDTNRIHARSCEIRVPTRSEKRTLLDENHVQGNDNAPIYYGAYHNGEILAVMTFSKPRVALGQKNRESIEGKWELSRFCTNTSYRIPGIASKLLKHFQRNHEWSEIYSYADKRWSTGNMYFKLGFEQVADNSPDYFYVINGKRKHRWNYRKDMLKTKLERYDPNLTEYQNMVNHGFFRVWDCGTLKFSMTNR